MLFFPVADTLITKLTRLISTSRNQLLSSHTKYYSKSSNGFYVSINEGIIPEDVVEITDELWQELLAGQSAGMVISSDSSGNPVLTTPPAPKKEQLVEMANNKRRD